MKLKAFSFLEIMVAIVISGIVIGTAYSVYVFTYKQFFKFSTIKTETRNYFELSSVLTNDFETAGKVIKSGEQSIQLQWVDKTIDYHFDNNYILRTVNLHTDTFWFSVNNAEINMIDALSNEHLVDYLKITTHNKSEEQSLSFSKSYGAIQYVEE